MNYIDIVYNDTSNAPGISTVLFVAGCPHNCPECHNPQSHDYNAGQPFEESEMFSIVHSLAKSYVKNLVISGGDPLCVKNFNDTLNFIKFVKDHTHKRIIIYTGEIWEEKDSRYWQLTNALEDGDMIIDGPYLKDLKTEERDFRGSTNQRALKINHSNASKIEDVSRDYFK